MFFWGEWGWLCGWFIGCICYFLVLGGGRGGSGLWRISVGVDIPPPLVSVLIPGRNKILGIFTFSKLVM